MPSRAGHYRAVALVFLAALLWSTGGLFIKSIDWNPLAIAGGRSLVAALFLLVVVGKPRLTRSRAMWVGAFAYAATVIGFVLSNKLTTSANAILLQFSAPIYVALLGAWLLGERVTRRDWIAIFLSLGGMALFFLDRLSAGSLLGNIIAIISGVTLAALVVALRLQRDSRPEYTILLGNALTALIGLPFMLQGAPGDLGWGGIAVMGVFQLALPYLLFSRAIRSLSALESILAQMVEPLLNPIWVFLFVRETPGPWALVGGAVVLGTITLRHAADLLWRRPQPLAQPETRLEGS